MKVAPVSADLLIKLTLIAAAVAGIWYAGKKATEAVSSAWAPLSNAVVSLGEFAPYVTPWSPQNVAYQSANSLGGYLSGDPSGNWNLGGYVYEVLHREPVALPPVNPYSPPAYDPTPGIY